jgi:ribonuclease HII
MLSADAREEVLPLILEHALAVGIGEAAPDEIDSINILRATWLAMQRALKVLSLQPTFLLVDGNQALPVSTPQRTIVKGDSICLSIAAASVVAKVHRDRYMVEQAARFPGYGFEKHKGYGTAEHLEALRRLGPISLHRRSFRGVLREPEDEESQSLSLFGPPGDKS